eukprot:7978850-Pyramimonas_sp.AAC.1
MVYRHVCALTASTTAVTSSKTRVLLLSNCRTVFSCHARRAPQASSDLSDHPMAAIREAGHGGVQSRQQRRPRDEPRRAGSRPQPRYSVITVAQWYSGPVMGGRPSWATSRRAGLGLIGAGRLITMLKGRGCAVSGYRGGRRRSPLSLGVQGYWARRQIRGPDDRTEGCYTYSDEGPTASTRLTGVLLPAAWEPCTLLVQRLICMFTIEVAKILNEGQDARHFLRKRNEGGRQVLDSVSLTPEANWELANVLVNVVEKRAGGHKKGGTKKGG